MKYQNANKITIELSHNAALFCAAIDKHKDEIEKIWETKRKLNPALINNLILSVGEIKKNADIIKLYCNPVEYKHYLAQKEGLDLNIKPIAISGITYYKKNQERYYLVGIRSNDVTSYPGCLEFVPSGSIDFDGPCENEINYYKQIITELDEEAGIDPTLIKRLKEYVLIYDEYDQVYDIGIMVEIKPTAKITAKNDEYSNLYIAPINEVKDLICKNKTVETSKTLFQLFNELQG